MLAPPYLLQVIEWFEEYAEEFFQTHTELGDSFDVATALSAEVGQFEVSTQVSQWCWVVSGLWNWRDWCVSAVCCL
jgi:hypothetical protein